MISDLVRAFYGIFPELKERQFTKEVNGIAVKRSYAGNSLNVGR